MCNKCRKMPTTLGAILDFQKSLSVYWYFCVSKSLNKYYIGSILSQKHIFRHLKCEHGLRNCKLWEKQETAAILGAILDFGNSSETFLGISVFWISEEVQYFSGFFVSSVYRICVDSTKWKPFWAPCGFWEDSRSLFGTRVIQNIWQSILLGSLCLKICS